MGFYEEIGKIAHGLFHIYGLFVATLCARQVEGGRGKSVSMATATGVLPLSDTHSNDDKGKGHLK
jgi:hypothetical protein